MNINNLHEAIPVEKDLPPVDKTEKDWEILEWSINVFVDSPQGKDGAFYAYREKVWYSNGKIIPGVTHWYRPVTRESIEAFLREFGEKYYQVKYAAAMKGQLPDRPITELINKTLGQ